MHEFLLKIFFSTWIVEPFLLLQEKEGALNRARDEALKRASDAESERDLAKKRADEAEDQVYSFFYAAMQYFRVFPLR